MTLIEGIATGFATSLTIEHAVLCSIGVVLGMVIGVLPGIGPTTVLATLLPITLSLDPAGALIMFGSIYYAAQYGDTITAVVLGIPGEVSAATQVNDGHALAKKGRAGPVLTIAAIGSFFAGCVSMVTIAIFAAPLSRLVIYLGPVEICSLMVVGLTMVAIIRRGSLLCATGLALVGILIGTIGSDIMTGAPRFAMGMDLLRDGVHVVPIMMGLFGLPEILVAIETKRRTKMEKIDSIIPSRDEVRRSSMPVLRGTLIGSVVGVIPGGTAVLSTLIAYAVEKVVSPHKKEFGEGAIEGVASPAAADNAAAQMSLVPLLSLGIPGHPITALMAIVLVRANIYPGPLMWENHPDIVWGVIAAMLLGNLMLLALNIPLVRIWTKLLQVPEHMLYPGIILCLCIGAYSDRNDVFDIFVMALAGAVGYGCSKFRMDPMPLVLGIFLGPRFEESFRRGLAMSLGDPTTFFTSPVSAGLLAAAACIIVLTVITRRRLT